MTTLKGQNLRILAFGLDGSSFACIGMATNCVVTLTNNVDESSTKDDVGLSSKPEVVSKSWSVQVDSLNVLNAAAMLAAIKGMQKVEIMWDEVGTSDNQTPVTGSGAAAYARKGLAYLSDLTLSFNDRENSAKNLQFTGASQLEVIPSSGVSYQVLDPGSYTKGQFVRLFLGSDNTTAPSRVIAFSKQLQVHVSLQMEDATTKDTEGNFQIQEPTGLSYDITSNALVRGGDSITSQVRAQGLGEIESIFEAGTPVKFQIANVSGTNNRTKGAVIMSGSVIVSQLTINAQNRQNATYDTQLNGYGEYTVGA
jgi:predicted secreted protein